MRCPDCYGTTIRLVPVPSTTGAAWVKIACHCEGGYVRTPLPVEPNGRKPEDDCPTCTRSG